MKNITLTFWIILILSSCGNPQQEQSSASATNTPTETAAITTPVNPSKTTDEPTFSQKIETENPHLIEKEDLSELAYLKTFIPDDHLVLDFEYGDLNKDDAKKDVILISHAATEQTDDLRNLYILTRTPDDKLESKDMNPQIVLCKECGGIFGDPYDNIVIKDGYFSVEHYGGSNWRWTNIITFKYDIEQQDWFLHKEGGVSYHTSNPDEMEEEVRTTKDFGVVSFAEYGEET